uniref:ABC transporter ATP-binding protein n=1 Tax=Bosea sp. NBC_00436 TaxID=2969620 RepID=A0A9E7ZMS1_9HYPH
MSGQAAMMSTRDFTEAAVPAAGSGPASLDVSGINLFYGATPALKDIDLTVAQGEFVALLGPSGCGKTSLLRSIAGFVQPQQGAIRLGGRDVAGLPPRERNIGIMFQSYALFPHMTVLENVLFGLECRKVPAAEARARAETALKRVSLSAFGDRRPKQLSGGQQQRVALARAIVIEPDLLLLDEPLGALDKQLRLQMQTELKMLQKSLGVTALFVTHDQEEAMTMADRIVVMRDGVIQQVDEPETLFTRPRNAWVSDFVSAGNIIHGELREAGGECRVEIAPGSTFTAAAGPGKAGEAVLFVPFHAVSIAADAASPLAVSAIRLLGLAIELQIAYGEHMVRVQLPSNRTAEFPIGTRVRLGADRADCRLLPKG